MLSFVENINVNELPEGDMETFVALYEHGMQVVTKYLAFDTAYDEALVIKYDFLLFLNEAHNTIFDSDYIDPQEFEADGFLADVDDAFNKAQNQFQTLSRQVATEKLKSLLKERNTPLFLPNLSDEVAISNHSLVSIHTELGSLKRAVNASTLDTSKKDKLLQVLNEFEAELNGRKIRRANALTTLALIAAGIGGGTSFLADAPGALQSIGKIAATLGIEIEAQDEAAKLLGPDSKTKALPAPSHDNDPSEGVDT